MLRTVLICLLTVYCVLTFIGVVDMIRHDPRVTRLIRHG